MKPARRLVDLTGREYLPMAAIIGLWIMVAAAVGHANAARLLAATTAVRGILLLTKLGTAMSLKRRELAPAPIRRQAQMFAFDVQASALTVALLLVVALVEALKAIGQVGIAATIPWIALGIPARYLRFTDVRTSSPYYRLASAGSGLAMVCLGWLLGWKAATFGLAFGLREWVAYGVILAWPRKVKPTRHPINEPLGFAEIARNSVIVARRLLTYRLTKTILTVFGPFGTFAARTSRGFNMHKRIEAYLPHHYGGFVLFCMATLGGSVLTALKSGEPAAMVAAAGLMQLAGTAGNVVLLWRYLPVRNGEFLPDDDDDDD